MHRYTFTDSGWPSRFKQVDHVMHANDVTPRNANANANGSSQGNASMQGVNAKFYVPKVKYRQIGNLRFEGVQNKCLDHNF